MVSKGLEWPEERQSRAQVLPPAWWVSPAVHVSVPVSWTLTHDPTNMLNISQQWALKKQPSEIIMLVLAIHAVGSGSDLSDSSNRVLSIQTLHYIPHDSTWPWYFKGGHCKKILISLKYLCRCMYSKTLCKISTSNSTTFHGLSTLISPPSKCKLIGCWFGHNITRETTGKTQGQVQQPIFRKKTRR